MQETKKHIYISKLCGNKNTKKIKLYRIGTTYNTDRKGMYIRCREAVVCIYSVDCGSLLNRNIWGFMVLYKSLCANQVLYFNLNCFFFFILLTHKTEKNPGESQLMEFACDMVAQIFAIV